MNFRALALVVAVLPLLIAGCASVQGPKVARPEVLPGYDQVADRFDVRVDRLSRVWSRVNLTLRSPREKGGTSVDRSEGHIQIELPDRTAVTVEKLMDVYLYFGSDAVGYWWIDLTDGDRKTALYGRHDEATPALVAELGLPVHPRELLDLIAITPLPKRGKGAVVAPGTVDWDADRGLLRVVVPAMWGTRTLWLDPVTMAPHRVELRDGAGAERASCEMSRPISVPVRGDGHVPPKLASRYQVSMPATGASLTMELYGAENKPIDPRAFDFKALVESYGVDEIYRLRPGEGDPE